MRVEIDPQFLGAEQHVIAVHATRESLVLHLLSHRARIHLMEALRGAHQRRCRDEPTQFIDGEKRPGHVRLAVDAAIGGVPKNGLKNIVRPAALPKHTNAFGWMLVGGRASGIGEPLVVEIVYQSSQSPTLGILAELFGVGPHGGLDGEHVLSKGFAGGVLVHERQRIGTRRQWHDWQEEIAEGYCGQERGARIEHYTAQVTAELGHQGRIVALSRRMTHLRSVSKQSPDPERAERFPFSVPVVRELDKLSLDAPVTFLVGENGSGKSTLLEALAAATGLPAIGALNIADDATLEAQRALGRCLKLVWRRRTKRGFFLRAEDFFGFTKTLAKMRADFLARLDEIDVEYQNRSAYAKGFARMPFVNSLADMEQRYGIDLDANSHGQSFLRLFSSRFVPGGLYLLDEPEAPLSPQSQLALIAMINEMVAQDAQFIIATHSPILLALPGALIYSCDRAPMQAMRFDELDHVVLTRDFLNDPERFLRHLR